MTLVITLFAAVFATVKWYTRRDDTLALGTLCLIYWGACLMWLVDGVFAYFSLSSAYFIPSPTELLNDTFLGLSAVALGLVAWLVVLFRKDPKGLWRAAASSGEE